MVEVVCSAETDRAQTRSRIGACGDGEESQEMRKRRKRDEKMEPRRSILEGKENRVRRHATRLALFDQIASVRKTKEPTSFSLAFLFFHKKEEEKIRE